jgi:hypothetical protein
MRDKAIWRRSEAPFPRLPGILFAIVSLSDWEENPFQLREDNLPSIFHTDNTYLPGPLFAAGFLRIKKYDHS